jgi:(p)ppGpp synthase/HD superfamily hydrolase
MLEKAIQLAITAHRGQRDKSGEPYILHPIRVMIKMDTEVKKVIAILHDVVEDSSLTLSDIQPWVSDEILDALTLLTRTHNQTYGDYIRDIKNNKLAKEIKIADLEDNINILRLGVIKEDDIKRMVKYWKAWRILHGGAEEI